MPDENGLNVQFQSDKKKAAVGRVVWPAFLWSFVAIQRLAAVKNDDVLEEKLQAD